MTSAALHCTNCGTVLPQGAHFCPGCGAEQSLPSQQDEVSGATAIGLASLLGVLGLVFIASAVGLWNAMADADGDAETVAALFGALALSVAALGVVGGDIAFVSYLRRSDAQEWVWWTQLIIVPAWLFAFLAALFAVTTS